MSSWRPELTQRGGPLYEQIANAMVRDIRSGLLKPGAQLPTHRDLASRLGVTVGTISRAFGEVLRSGLIVAGARRGSRVVEYPPDPTTVRFANPEFLPVKIDLRAHRAVRPAWKKEIRQAIRETIDRADFDIIVNNESGIGRFDAREAAEHWFRMNGIADAGLHPERILVCNGAQHALLTALLTVCKAGDRVATESLTYTGLKAIAPGLGLNLIGVRHDRDGILPEALEELCSAGGISALVCVPNIHNPTTSTMSLKRRQAISVIAERHNFTIIEIDVLGCLVSDPIEPLSMLAPTRTFRLTSLTKALGPGLRIGYLQVPAQHVVEALFQVQATSWFASPIAVGVATHMIQKGAAAVILDKNKVELGERNIVAKRILAEFTMQQAPFSPHLWLNLPEGWKIDDFGHWSRRSEILALTADQFSVGPGAADPAIRISVSAPRDIQELTNALGLIASALREAPPRQEAIA